MLPCCAELDLIAKIPPHPTLVRIHGVCTDFPSSDGGPRMVLEYCAGGSLKSYMSTLGTVSRVVAKVNRCCC